MISEDPRIPTPTHKPVLSRPAEQPSYAIGKDTYTFFVEGKHTGGAFAVFDGIIPATGGPPPHCHGYEETLFVLDGELTVFCEDMRVVLTANGALNIPSWSPHMLKNYGSSPVRLICVTSPPGLEDQFVETGVRVPGRDSATPELSEEEQRRIAAETLAGAERHRAHFLPEDTFDHMIDQSGQGISR